MKTIFLSFTFFIFFNSSSFALFDEFDNEKDQKITQQNIQTKGIIPAYDHNLGKDVPQNRFASKIADGTLELNDVPLLIIYWINYVTWIAGSISVIFLVYGGYQYMFSGVTDDKEDGKKTVLYVACGLPVIFFAWYMVNFLQNWITSSL